MRGNTMSTRKTNQANYNVDTHLRTVEKKVEDWPFYEFSSTKARKYQIDTILV